MLRGTVQSDLAKRVHQAWARQVQERILSQCLQVGSCRILVELSKAFTSWKLKTPQGRKQLVQYSGPTGKQTTAQEILASPSRSPDSTRFKPADLLSNVANDIRVISPNEMQRNSLYERLFREAELKNAFIKRARALKDSQEMNHCTFKPEINKSPVRLHQPVHER